MGVEEDQSEAMARARLSLEGLSLGDGFGERFFKPQEIVEGLLSQRALPARPWGVTDDTMMAISVVEELSENGVIEPGSLASRFARRYMADRGRGYGAGAHRLLQSIAAGGAWREESSALFGGSGSYGNGAAMRVAPLGAYFAEDLDEVVEQARRSAIVTHSNPEGIAGGVAIAVASAMVWRTRGEWVEEAREEIFAQVLARTPESVVRQGVARAQRTSLMLTPQTAAQILGNGSKISAQDTVPFCMWSVARGLADWEEAVWATVSALGDRDTTAAIVGGVLAMRGGREALPQAWLEAREPLEDL